MKNALGMIETIGLVPMIEAVDAMTKAADVNVLHWEKVGGGRVTAFVEGEVAAVKAAIDAGAESCSKLGEVTAAQVIPNPHGDLSAYTGKAAAKGGKKKK